MSRMYENLFIATAYGDAVGLPYETLSKQRIQNLGGVRDKLQAPGAFTDFADFHNLPVGAWSDDTQHALAVQKVLTSAGGFSLANLASELRREMGISDKGWGGATKNSIRMSYDYMTDQELRILGNKTSAGCGPLMRIGPISVYGYYLSKGAEDSLSNSMVKDMVEDSTTLTHNNPESVTCALTHHQLIQDIVEQGLEQALESLDDSALKYEELYSSEPKLSGKLGRIGLGHDNRTLEDDLAFSVYDNDVFAAWSVLSIVYGVMSKHPGCDLEELVKKVVEEGGDTDSTASIAASLWVIANPESDDMPEETKKLDQYDRLVEAGAVFSGAIENLVKTTN